MLFVLTRSNLLKQLSDGNRIILRFAEIVDCKPFNIIRLVSQRTFSCN